MDMKEKGMTAKGTLAMAYAPGLTKKAAYKRLALWIDTCEKLSRELEKSGYRKYQKKLTPKQLSLIYKYLGKP